MKKNDRINLDSISNIDEKIIDEVTDKKISLLQKAGKTVATARKKFIAIGAAAASLVLVASVVLVVLIPLMGSAVPVYRGMTIRKEATASVSTQKNGDFTGLSLLNTKSHVGLRPLGQSDGQHKERDDTLQNGIEDLVTIDVVTDDEVRYYVNPGETFIIEIHIDNPKDYEIQSFTLNGQKYANYMFKEGSTMELLLLEVTAPSEPGYVEYTIDAIKYIDGTEIKDVDMSEGDKSVKVGVAHTSTPTATVSDVVIGTTNLSFSVNISDPQALLSQNSITAYLSDGEKIVASQTLSLGDNQVTFQSLTRGKTYEYGIWTAYDSIDGNGMQAHWLHTAYVTTNAPYISVENVVARGDEITFEIAANDADGVVSIDKIELYKDDVLLQVADNPSIRAFTEAVTQANYIIKVSYSYDLGNGSKKAEIAEGYPEYSITYHTNGGQLENAVSTFTWNDLPLKLNYPTQSGTVFDGWYLDAAATLLLKNSEITSVGDVVVYAKWAEATDGLTFEVSSDHVTVTGYNGNDTEVLIPERYLGLPVTEIGEYAFHNKDHVVSVTMGDGIKVINDYAFMNMDSLTQMTIGSNVTSIGQYAFNYCQKLTSVIISDRVVIISKDAFSYCDALIMVTLGESVETIEAGAFTGCLNLVEVYNKSNLTITAGTSKHGDIGRCASNIYTPNSGDSKIYIENGYVFYYSDSGWYLHKYIGTESKLKLPDTCKGNNYYIGARAFADNTIITSVVIPEGVTGIEGWPQDIDGAFYGCSNLQSVTIPSTVTYLQGPFRLCYKLKTITYNGTVEQWNALIPPDFNIYYETGSFDVHCTDGTV